MLNWKSLGIGIALAVVMFFTLIVYKLDSISILAFIIAPLIGGYVVGGNLKVGAIYGAIIGFFGTIIALSAYIALGYYLNTQLVSISILILILILRTAFYTVIGAIMGVVGALIKNKLVEKK